jgi:prenyltransferase beta subunit
VKELEKIVDELELELLSKDEKIEEFKDTISKLEKEKQEFIDEKENLKKKFMVCLKRKLKNNLLYWKLNMKKLRMNKEQKMKRF